MGGGLEPFGDAAWRAALPPGLDALRRRALLDALRRVDGVLDAVVTEGHALVVLAPGRPLDGVRDALDLAARGGVDLPDVPVAREYVVRVRYDGPDLDDVAAAAGISPADVPALHAGRAYEVAVVGFLPGFAYLRGLDPRLVLPRRPAPRTRVPALSVAIAGPYAGVYPFASPGGWHLLGTALGFTAFDARAGATLALGDRVRFVDAAREGTP